MNKANLKSYAPQARLDFIAAVTARANLLGITGAGVASIDRRGDLAIIEGREWPTSICGPREKLVELVEQHGFGQAMEEVAYTWFNRFAALRFMEIHDYLDHGWRVLSSRDGGLPEILSHASEVSLPGLSQAKAMEMQTAGNLDNELYRMLLVAQCNSLSRVMPFLFERIDDLTELLLPDNLLRTDSILSKMISEVPEEDWQEIEVIGWLYQFYISDRKDQVIGKVVKSADIPAATQLFTPNWIVKYMVQNTLGRLWLCANPQSPLAQSWSYFIEPAEQAADSQAHIDAAMSGRIREDGETLSPESIKVLDPACGSGHILVVAYEALKAIYLERGYQPRSIARLILENNIYGVDIDDRAAQMAGFALLMKARADDRRLFTAMDEDGRLLPIKLNVISLQESRGLNAEELGARLAEFGIQRATLSMLLSSFEGAKTFGSLIKIPYALATQLDALSEALVVAAHDGDMYARSAADDLRPLVDQARLMAMQFDVVLANPPYMGARYYDNALKNHVEKHYKQAKGDLYTCFMVRNVDFAREGGVIGMVTIPNWMFLSTFEELREWLFSVAAIETFSHNGRGVFGSDFGSCAFTFRRQALPGFKGRYKRLFERAGSVASNEELDVRFGLAKPFVASIIDFRKIPGSPIAYWISDKIRDTFTESRSMSELVDAKQSLATADNDRFLRMWQEVSVDRIGFGMRSRDEANISGKKWFPHQKGGEFRKWYGNHEWLVNWEKDGDEIRNFKDENGKVKSRPQGTDYYFKECVSWSDVTSAANAFRYDGHGFIPNVIAPALFKRDVDLRLFLLAGNNVFYNFVSKVLNPTIHFHVGYFSTLPFPEKLLNADLSIADELISIAKADWDAVEVSWGFTRFPWVDLAQHGQRLGEAWAGWAQTRDAAIKRMQSLEVQNNKLFIEAYELQDELSSDVPLEQITLGRPDRENDTRNLISYALGCLMGRYSLDEPGLVYARSGNVGFEPGRYPTFCADSDGIVPVAEGDWFGDDGLSRLREFVGVVWGKGHLEENMAWIADSMGQKPSEIPEEAIRRYIADKFYKDHLQTYKKRPIYWLFSSGKQGAFQALVYMHRYNEGTLSRMRSEYVIPLSAKFIGRLEMLEKDAAASSSAAARTKIQKQIESLRKKQAELLTYDEKLRHYADMRISIDLDDGVKANYAKFGDLVAESKAITGGSDE